MSRDEPTAGKLLTFSVHIVAAGSRQLLRPAKVLCVVRVGSNTVRTTNVAGNGRASCSVKIPMSTHRGTVIHGALTTIVKNQRVVRRFSTWVR